MAEKFQNRYRIPSARLAGWDYRDDAMYFITICCKDRRHYFGRIENGQMVLSEIGQVCHKYLLEIPEHFPFVWVDAAIVMPDHLHAILVIDRGNCDGSVASNGSTPNASNGSTPNASNGSTPNASNGSTPNASNGSTSNACNGSTSNACNGSTPNACNGSPSNASNGSTSNACNGSTSNACNRSTTNQLMASISPKPGSLSTIVRSFKSAVTKDARFINPDFNWQTRFHDHIIRSAGSHQRIKKYIEDNPQNWDEDKFREMYR